VLHLDYRMMLIYVVPVVISGRLVSSPCAIVADAGGYTANVEKLMS
jgi:heat shock protein beta